MAKRKKVASEGVSLFPFLSILACVIGTLTLMITAMSLSQVGKEQPEEELERFEQFETLQSDIEVKENALAATQIKIEDARALQRQLTVAKAELKQLETSKQQTMSSNSEKAKLLAESGRLRKRIEALKQESPELQKQIAELSKKVALIKKPKEAEVLIQPGGTGVDLNPTFVEVNSGGVVIYASGKEVRIRRADLDKSGGDFHKLVDKVAKQPKGSVIFLLRSDPAAIGTYNTARYVARARYCRNGKLPVPGNGKIDLSVFEKKGQS